MPDARATRDDFQFLDRIGRGASSVVYKCRRKEDGGTYCIKEIDIAAVTPEEEQEALKEVHLLASFDHPYVIRYYDSFVDDEMLHIVMEFASHGTLIDRIKKQNGVPLPESQVWRWSLHIFVGLNHMHERKILHRDLKSANIFIAENGDAKIGDLGVSRMLTTHQQMAHTIVGTPYYLSPELCEGRPYNEKSDVWALGCIMFEMCTDGAHPFQASNQGALIMKILSERCDAVPSRYSDGLRAIVAACMNKEPAERPDTWKLLSSEEAMAQARKEAVKMPPTLAARIAASASMQTHFLSEAPEGAPPLRSHRNRPDRSKPDAADSAAPLRSHRSRPEPVDSALSEMQAQYLFEERYAVQKREEAAAQRPLLEAREGRRARGGLEEDRKGASDGAAQDLVVDEDGEVVMEVAMGGGRRRGRLSDPTHAGKDKKNPTGRAGGSGARSKPPLSPPQVFGQQIENRVKASSQIDVGGEAAGAGEVASWQWTPGKGACIGRGAGKDFASSLDQDDDEERPTLLQKRIRNRPQGKAPGDVAALRSLNESEIMSQLNKVRITDHEKQGAALRPPAHGFSTILESPGKSVLDGFAMERLGNRGGRWKKGISTIAATPQKGLMDAGGAVGRTWSPAVNEYSDFKDIFGVPDSPLHRLVHSKFGDDCRDDSLIGLASPGKQQADQEAAHHRMSSFDQIPPSPGVLDNFINTQKALGAGRVNIPVSQLPFKPPGDAPARRAPQRGAVGGCSGERQSKWRGEGR